MTNHDEDQRGEERDFQRDLAVLAERYRAASTGGPPAELDAAIRAAARTAVAPPRQRTWWVPVSVAATLVIAVSVGVQMRRAPPSQDMQPTAITESAPAQSVAAPLPELAAEPDPLRQSTTSPAEAAAAAAMPDNDARAEAIAAPAMAPALAPASLPATEAERVADSAMSGKAAPQAAELRARALESSAERAVAAPPAAATPAAADVPAAAGAGLEPPERWLARIEALRRAGQISEADAELARLRAAYPGWLETREQRRE